MDDRSTAISAAEVADDRAEIAAAVKSAKAFRDKLEGVGISYHLHGAPDPDDHDARRGGRAAVP